LLSRKIVQGYEVVIFNGLAKGADLLGSIYARMHQMKTAEFPARWDKHGKSAGPIRNELMGREADAAVVFLVDGIETAGSMHMFNFMGLQNKPRFLCYRSMNGSVILFDGVDSYEFEIVMKGGFLCLKRL